MTYAILSSPFSISFVCVYMILSGDLWEAPIKKAMRSTQHCEAMDEAVAWHTSIPHWSVGLSRIASASNLASC